MPGALDAVAALRGVSSLPVAVCSGSYASVIEAALARLGIASRSRSGTPPSGSRSASPIPAPT